MAQPAQSDWSSFNRWHAMLDAAGTQTVDLLPVITPSQTSLVLNTPRCDAHTARRLTRFVNGGGRLLLITEANESAPCLQAFGLAFSALEQSTPASEGTELFSVFSRGWTGLTASPTTPPIANRPRLVTHLDGFEPTWDIGPNEGIGFHLQMGRGDAVVLSDSSLFIDLMLALPGNQELSKNLVQWLTNSRDIYRTTPNTDLLMPDDIELDSNSYRPIHPAEWATLVTLSILMGIIIVGFAMRFLWQTQRENRIVPRAFPHPRPETIIGHNAMEGIADMKPPEQQENRS